MNNLFSKSILRTPIYSLEQYNAVLSLNKIDLFKYLRKDHLFLYALYTSSPGLHDGFTSIIDFDEKIHNKLLLSCFKYYVRMCTRCVPFGLFSGVSVIEHEKNNPNSHIIRGKFHKTHTRLDSNYYNLLNNSFNNGQKLNLKYHTNTSLYKLGKVYRYTEYTTDSESGKRKYILSQIESNKIISKIINLCTKGAFLRDILELLLKEGYEREESKEYIISLIDSQVIVDSLVTSAIGDVPEKYLLATYQENPDSNEYKFLKSMNDLFYEIDNSDYRKSFTKTKELESLLLTKTQQKANRLYFHKEVYYDASGYEFENSKLLKNAVEHIRFVGQKVNPSNTRMAKFIDVYKKRYGDTTQKLTDVLDIESGIGYGNFLNSGGIDDTSILSGLKNIDGSLPSIDLTPVDLFLLNKIKNNINSKGVVIQEKELQQFKDKTANRIYEGASFSYMCNIYENKDEKKFIFLNGIGGNATKLIGRFTNGDRKIKALAQEISDYEKEYYSDYTCVELDYIPESSLGNVIHRESFRDFKISFLAGVKQDISVDDLLIQVENSKVILYTKKGEKILPFFSNAFNINHPKNLPVFELLVDVLNQFEMSNANFFDIKHYHIFLSHIPRISINNTILHRESWMISMENLKLSQDSVFSLDVLQNFNEYFKKVNIPVNFIIANGDNELVINTKNSLALEIFFNEIKKKKSLIIYEWLLDDLTSITKSEDMSSFNNEFLFLKKNVKQSGLKSSSIKKDVTLMKSNMIPYSEWVYFKIDIGNKTVDNFLINLLPIVKKLINIDVVSKFFYIKYTEESFQLRLRFLLTDPIKYIILLDTLVPFIQNYIVNKQVIKFSLDTYEREILRYYGEKIIEFETIFFHDSLLSIEMIKKGKRNDTPVWMYCLEYTYMLLEEVLVDSEVIFRYLNLLKDSFDKEFNSNRLTTKSINVKYEKNLQDIHRIVIQNDYSLSVQNRQFKTVVKLVKKLQNENEENIFVYLSNIVHMHIIRVVQNENRLYEYLIYSFLFKAIKTKKHVVINQKNNFVAK